MYTAHKEYLDAVAHNQAILKKCLNTRSIDFSDIVFWNGTSARELSFDEVAAKWADVLGCTAIGAIPSLEKTGEDGHLWYSDADAPVPIETKVCGIRHGDLALGSRRGLYYSTNLDNPNSKCAITSHFHGKFATMSWDTLQTKNRDTFLILFDKTENKIIDTWGIKGEKTLKLLESKQSNATITLKLSAFMYHGFHMKSGGFNNEGFEVWENRMIRATKRRIQYEP